MFRRESAHHPKVDVGELSLLGDKKVAGMWIGVEEADVEDLCGKRGARDQKTGGQGIEQGRLCFRARAEEAYVEDSATLKGEGLLL